MKLQSYKKGLKKSKKIIPKAYLFGPFLGELSWEFYRFVPYVIYLKKNKPKIKNIVLTREERFGLYGPYADILVPLRIKGENIFRQNCFGLEDYKIEYYETIKKYFYEKYNKRYNIVEHFCPLVNGWRKKIRWQFPRDKMSYDFCAKEKTRDIVNAVIRSDDVIIDSEAIGYVKISNTKQIKSTDLFRELDIGLIIEAIKKCEYVIGNLKFDLSHLAILLKKPLISVNEGLSNDDIHLLNPLKTPIIKCRNINEGVEIYENNFRSSKGGTGEQRRGIHFNKIG